MDKYLASEIKVKPFETKLAHRFFGVASTLVQREIRQGNTITLISEIDLTEILNIRENWQQGKKPTYTAFIAKAAAVVLKEFPYANRRLYRVPWLPFTRTKLQYFNSCDIAVACERDVPEVEVATFMDILRDADKLSLSEITEWLHALSMCDVTNNKQWSDFLFLITKFPSWLSSRIISLPLYFPQLWWKWRGGALSISSPGKYGVDVMIGAWPSPLGVSFGFAKDRVVVKGGQIVICPTFNLTLNFDRRVMAGAQAARFFKRIVDILENPRKELVAFLK